MKMSIGISVSVSITASTFADYMFSLITAIVRALLAMSSVLANILHVHGVAIS